MASRGVNKVILIGNLGQEPEIRYMPNGGIIANLALATSENWKDKQSGKIREKTEWHRIIIFGKLAEIASEYLHKGAQVYIEGSLRTRKWQDSDGKDHYSTEIIVGINGSMKMLGNRNNEFKENVIDKYKQENKNNKENLFDSNKLNNLNQEEKKMNFIDKKQQIFEKDLDKIEDFSLDLDEDIPF